jgi:hypothetical protein
MAWVLSLTRAFRRRGILRALWIRWRAAAGYSIRTRTVRKAASEAPCSRAPSELIARR